IFQNWGKTCADAGCLIVAGGDRRGYSGQQAEWFAPTGSRGQRYRAGVHVHGDSRRIIRSNSADCGRTSEAHTSEIQSLMRTSYAVFWLKKTKTSQQTQT